MSVHVRPELADLRQRMRDFIDGEVVACEPVLAAHDAAAEARLEELKAEAKRRDLWALGHPAEIGGGGLPFMDFVYLNEIIGRSEWGQVAVGSVSMQDSIMLHRYASGGQRERFLKPLVNGEVYPSVGLTEPDAHDGGARWRRVGHQRAQVVHHGRAPCRVHDGVRDD
jgi:alkylation response protein AidB-like acyl-CoA dehydrogenase